MSTSAIEPEEETLGLIGKSRAVCDLRAQIRRIATTSAPVLIIGETGVGKELVARAIHRLSPRASGPMLCVNCGALNRELLESELFGHERGAFTGATGERKGKFDSASSGILFLDEINSTALDFQVKLLRVLQDQNVTPVGSDASHLVDVRVIAASNQNLEDQVRGGQFRQDLFYRLNVLTVNVPALRERDDDVVCLADHFVRTYCVRESKTFAGLSETTVRILRSHKWPGNVRELENVIQRAVVLAQANGPDVPLDVTPAYMSLTASSAPGESGIADRVFDALLANRRPLDGMLQGDTSLGDVAGYVLCEIEAGLDRYLSSAAGQELLEKRVRMGVVFERMGLSGRRPGNPSQFAAALRRSVEAAFERHASG